jgi:hypothetical protein
MVLLSALLPWRAGRWANVAAGTVMTAVQAWSLFQGTPAGYYVFFSIIEMTTTALVVVLALRRRPDVVPGAAPVPVAVTAG